MERHQLGSMQEDKKVDKCRLLVIGGCALCSWSRTQSVIAQSGGEAEWYGIASAAAEADVIAL